MEIVKLVKKQKRIFLFHKNPKKLISTFTKKIKIVIAGGGVVTNKKDEILFIYRRNKWDLPKGKMDKGETVKDTALREVMEETGINSLKIIDFCTGSGCILLSIAKKFPNHEYIGLDKSELAIKTAEKNRKSLGLKNVQFFNQDIFEYNKSKADLLLCNPPYLAKHEIDSLEQSVRDYDPLSALTDFKNGTSFYKYLISNFNKLVKKNGIMLLEIPFSTVTDDIISINKNFNANKSLFYKDLEGKNRVIKIY